MENNCIISIGANSTCKENMINKADGFAVAINGENGELPLIGNIKKNWHQTRSVSGVNEPASVIIPYSAKLLLQELQTLGVDMRLETRSDTITEIEKEYTLLSNRPLESGSGDRDDNE